MDKKITWKTNEARYKDKIYKYYPFNLLLLSMKKLLLMLFISIFSTTIYAQNLWDLIDNLWNEIAFWYTSTQKVSVKTIDNEKIILESPLITKQDGEQITNYTIMYNEHSLIEILNQTDLLDATREKTYNLTWSNSPFTMELWMNDGLDISKKYYLFILPKDGSGNLGEVSNEIWFNISDKTYWDAWSDEIYTANETTTNDITHNAAWADMSLANITHSISNNTINLMWISIDWSDSIDISVMTPWSSSFNRVATVNMRDERYSFVANRNWEYIFQFTPDNGWRQVNYTVQINTIATTPNGGTTTVWITKVPKTWPAENAIIIFSITAIWYLLYRRIYKKAK